MLGRGRAEEREPRGNETRDGWRDGPDQEAIMR